MDVNALLTLLDSINLNADCISEITVGYRYGKGEPINIAKLKNSTSILTFPLVKNINRLTAGYILDNMNQVLVANRNKYYEQIEKYFCNVVEEGGEYDFQEVWVEQTL